MVARSRVQKDGPLKGHAKTGSKFTPPMLAFPGMNLVEWTTTDLPDLLWPAALIASDGYAGLERFMRWQERTVATLRHHEHESRLSIASGRLTDLEADSSIASTGLGATIIEDLRDAALVSDRLLVALRLYRNLPGHWLLVDPWSDRSPDITAIEALNSLDAALISVGADPAGGALLKYTVVSFDILTDQVKPGEQILDLLKAFPHDAPRRSMAESVIRGSYMSKIAADDHSHPERVQRRLAWSKSFWQQSWRLTPCHVLDEDDEQEPVTDEQFVGQLLDEVASTLEAFLAVVYLDRDIDDYDRSQVEVVAGLVTRAARSAASGIGAPHQWNGEYGSHITRLLAETRIVLKYLHYRGPEFYSAYKAYGEGKLKLARRNLARLAESFPDEPPPFVVDALAKMTASTGGELGESFVEVDVGSTFSGISMREMARQVDEEEFYRAVFQSSSAVIHGEWWTLENYSMQPCLNALHGLHVVPYIGSRIPSTPALAQYWASTAVDLMGQGLEQLGLAWHDNNEPALDFTPE